MSSKKATVKKVSPIKYDAEVVVQVRNGRKSRSEVKEERLWGGGFKSS